MIPPSKGFCDLVMKGGITSRIVYPPAVLELAKEYALKNIGGTSAGAIAAGAAAAAELGRRKLLAFGEQEQKMTPPSWSAHAGYAGLASLVEQLSTPGFIVSLFQPTPQGKPVLKLLLALVSKQSSLRKALAIGSAAIRLAGGWVMIAVAGSAGCAAALAVLLGTPVIRTIITVLPHTILLAGLAGVIGSAIFGARAVHRNMFGLCTGLKEGAEDDGLTDWLNRVLKDLAGLAEHARPLTFDDLTEAPRFLGEPKQGPAIRLELMSTNLGYQEPHRIPFTNRKFWFLEEEFRRLFPREVVDWMIEQSDDDAIVQDRGKTYRLLPESGKLPVLVAIRMSLSFPLLLSAVPLYVRHMGLPRAEAASDVKPTPDVIDEESNMLQVAGAPETDAQAKRFLGMRVCWFSDGGISSNFPIHFFDASLPQWPTFGIDLFYPDPEHFDTRPQVFMPRRNNEGWQPTYVALEGRSSIVQVLRFVKTIVTTMQNWRDTLQSRAPGYRDRIVHIRIGAEEGGMNLDMPRHVLEPLTERGALAGRAVVEDFDFNNHMWIRYRNMLAGLEPYITEFTKIATEEPWPTYSQAWKKIKTGEQPPASYEWLARQRLCAEMVRNKLIDLGVHWRDVDDDESLLQRAPRPLPELRLVPRV